LSVKWWHRILGQASLRILITRVGWGWHHLEMVFLVVKLYWTALSVWEHLFRCVYQWGWRVLERFLQRTLFEFFGWFLTLSLFQLLYKLFFFIFEVRVIFVHKRSLHLIVLFLLFSSFNYKFLLIKHLYRRAPISSSAHYLGVWRISMQLRLTLVHWQSHLGVILLTSCQSTIRLLLLHGQRLLFGVLMWRKRFYRHAYSSAVLIYIK
jgi:hypothetical protein